METALLRNAASAATTVGPLLGAASLILSRVAGLASRHARPGNWQAMTIGILIHA